MRWPAATIIGFVISLCVPEPVSAFPVESAEQIVRSEDVESQRQLAAPGEQMRSSASRKHVLLEMKRSKWTRTLSPQYLVHDAWANQCAFGTGQNAGVNQLIQLHFQNLCTHTIHSCATVCATQSTPTLSAEPERVAVLPPLNRTLRRNRRRRRRPGGGGGGHCVAQHCPTCCLHAHARDLHSGRAHCVCGEGYTKVYRVQKDETKT